MKKSLLCAIMMLSSLPFADAQQNNTIEVLSEINSQNKVVFRTKGLEAGIHTIVLNIYDHQNLSTQKFQRFTVTFDRNFHTISPLNPEKPVSYRYGYIYAPGSVNPKKVDPRFVYRLPFSTSESRETRELYDIYLHLFGKSQAVNLKAYQFMMNRGDTVYAARKGVVIRVIDRHEPIIGKGEVSLSSQNNQVYVEHADGTIALYSVLEKGSIRVKSGDTVYPGTPIALAGTFDGEIYQMRFQLFHQVDNLDEITELADYSITYHGINPLFATSSGETYLSHGASHTSVTSEELVTKEMTRREVKDRKP